jgi:hypothetical protein
MPAKSGVLLIRSMLTLFAIPKHFRGHVATIQRNAIASWTRLTPRPEIILFGDEEGAAETARELGLRHFPEVARNEFGTPLLGDLFRQAEQRASTPLLAYANADIILTDDFIAALDRVRAGYEKFMMVGRRWDLDWELPLDFSQPGWAESIRANALRANVQRPGNYVDYFVYSRGLCDGLLPLAIGRFSWDNYILWHARSRGAELVDASRAVVAVHQNHDFSHHPQGMAGIREGPERKRNREMVGAWWHLYTIEDATQILAADGMRPSHRHAWLMAKRLWSHPLTILQLPWLAVKRIARV